MESNLKVKVLPKVEPLFPNFIPSWELRERNKQIAKRGWSGNMTPSSGITPTI